MIPEVIPARLYGHKEETGALIEILLLKRKENNIWECLVKTSAKKPAQVQRSLLETVFSRARSLMWWMKATV